MTSTQIDREKVKKERVFDIALGESLKYSVIGTAVVGAATLYLTYRFENKLTSYRLPYTDSNRFPYTEVRSSTG